MSDLTLQNSFPEHDCSDWKALAEGGLRGAAFDTLIAHTEDGLVRGPLFDAVSRPDDNGAIARFGVPLLDGRPWHICAPVSDSDLTFANTQLLQDLSGGASAVRIMGEDVQRRADLKRLLEGVHVELVPVIFAPKSSAARFAIDLDELHQTNVTLGHDPTGDRPELPERWRAFTADTTQIHETGGTDGLELAGFAAAVAESFRRHGPDAHDQMSALFALGTDAHLNIVKLRAARWLYARIAGAFGIENASVPIHAISSQRIMQGRDAWTNLLRTMSAGFGAVVGGADYITLRAFTDTPEDRKLGGATDFGHRIARNQQLLMMEESHLGQVADPAHGSYFHETLTRDLAQLAWSKFQQIEADGGFTQYRKNGAMDADCKADAAERAERSLPIVGVTLHPADDVPAPEVRS